MRRFTFFIIVATVIFLPTAAHAVTWLPVVPCGSSGQAPCSPCHLFQAFHNVIDLVLYGMTGPVAAFLIVWAGGMMLLSAGSAIRFSNGKKMLTNTLIGVTIILLSWVFVNFIIKSLATGNQGDSWYQFTCPAGLSSIVNIETTFPSVVPPSAPSISAALATMTTTYCDPANLAAVYKVPNNTKLNAPSLTTLMSCVEQDPIVKKLAILSQDAGKFTYGVTKKICNLTRGNPECGGPCDHPALNNCHYGGRTGNQGAMAVDYNATGATITYVITTRAIVSSTSDAQCTPAPAAGATPNPIASGSLCRTVSGEQGLFDELYRSMVKNKCQYKLLNFEVDHTHISTADCTADVTGIRNRKTPSTP